MPRYGDVQGGKPAGVVKKRDVFDSIRVKAARFSLLDHRVSDL